MTAISNDRVSRVVGYEIQKGDFRTLSPNLPQKILIFAEANTDNQATLDITPKTITNLRQAGELYGYGSPVYNNMRILRPRFSDGVGGIPTVVIAQAEAAGATAKMLEINVSGTATAGGTHYVILAGRDNVDGSRYAINIESGDSVAAITAKITNAINNVLGSPMTAADWAYSSMLTSKWKGLTANDLNVSMEVGDNDLGLTYTIENIQDGAGTPDIDAALAQIGNEWHTWVLNAYGTVNSIMNTLQDFNGIPKSTPDEPTGRYRGIVWKPFIAVTGSVAEDPSTFTDSRLEEVTIAIAPAPLSKGLPMEAAANMILLAAVIAQNNPELDVAGRAYPDMPTPDAIGTMADYNERDTIVKKGCSTVDLVSGAYQVQDFVTTYHKLGEEPPQFRYCRNLVLDMNVRYGYLLKEALFVLDHSIANDDDLVETEKFIKPKDWKGILADYAVELTKRSLIVDAPFMQANTIVRINSNNPDRFDTTFKYKRSGFVRQAATVAEAGFNFGTV